MKCINKYISILLIASFCMSLVGCASKEYTLKYNEASLPDEFNIESRSDSVSVPLFAHDLCASAVDITDTSAISYEAIKSAGVYDINSREVLYSYNANERVNPASLTKVMTALLTLEYVSEEGHSLDEYVTIGDVTINEDGVQAFGLKEGYQVSIRDLLYITLIYSGNDAALALAIHIGGSEQGFVDMMNEKAVALGATNTNFENPHGLSSANHYTSAYDLYLIFNEAVKYDDFVSIINMNTATIGYTNNDGEHIEKTINTTNKFLTGDYNSPDTLAIIGGKTGSTLAAGKCIILYSQDSYGNPYIAVVMGASDESSLYNSMRQLLNECVN